ncbi:MAG: bifunctional non-ous end joining protein LigD [Myxococcales bacterium]|nr:bifunctional non-ous end joining protein LigD [Myxococcales bacterium]
MAARQGGSKLGDYRRKRRPEATNEPFGGELPGEARAGEGTLSGAFVVHLHDATRRHYDLRLEVGGVLASFAVPRGPSLDPDDKALAVKTEDHPIEYLDFEDVIPAKQYGAGAMIAWDRGLVDYLEGPAEEEIANGKIHVELRGMKLRGRYALVKLAKSAKGDEWLLFKKADEHSNKERVIVDELPRSVLSGLTVDELEDADAIAEAQIEHARSLGGVKLTARAVKELLAPERSPLVMPAQHGNVDAKDDSGWIYDAELEGVRVLAARDGDVVTLHIFDASGVGQPIEAFYPDVVRALRALPASRIVLDGELVAFDASGHPSVKLLAQRVEKIAKGDTHRATTVTPVVLVAKDLLALGDVDVRRVPLTKRRALLARVLPELGFLRASPPLEGALAPILGFCTEHGVPGVVAKKKSAPYANDAASWIYVPTGSTPRPRTAVDHRAADARAVLRRVEVTNRAKLFWPEEGYTKGDLCDYYASVAEVILPYLADRPVILVRYPDGIAGKNFYQWNVPPGMPAWVRTLSVADENDEPKRGFLLDDASTLLYIANLACIPLHILACRVPRLEQADFFTVDFDVKQSELKHAITLTKRLHEHLDAIGLPSFAKTSGQSGLHVLVPLGEGQSFATARALADLLGKLLVEEFPDIATMERIVARRGPRVYVDTGQTGQTRAIVAPWSVRAVVGATVSTPLAWEEVDHGLDPRAFTMKTVPARIAKHGDPMRGLVTAKPDVARAVARLSELVAPTKRSGRRRDR